MSAQDTQAKFKRGNGVSFEKGVLGAISEKMEEVQQTEKVVLRPVIER